MASRDVEGIGGQQLMGTIRRVVKGVDSLLKKFTMVETRSGFSIMGIWSTNVWTLMGIS